MNVRVHSGFLLAALVIVAPRGGRADDGGDPKQHQQLKERLQHTAIRFFKPGIGALSWRRRPSGTEASNVRSMELTPGSLANAARTSFSIASRSGQAGVVRVTRSDTRPSLTWTFLAIPSVTMSLCSSGSITPRSASITAVRSAPAIRSFPSRDGCPPTAPAFGDNR